MRGSAGQQLYTLRHILELWLESQAEITNVSYRMNSAIAPDRRSAVAAERVDSLPVLDSEED